MKKFLATAMAAVIAVGMSVAAIAAPLMDESGALKNTVTGFEGGAMHAMQDLTVLGGTASVPFNLGENASLYGVTFTFVEGGDALSASYSRVKSAISLTPREGAALAGSAPYELEIAIYERETMDSVAEGYSISGTLTYDNVQQVESGFNYRSRNGVLYNFGKGQQNVKIDTEAGVVLALDGSATGLQNFKVTNDSNSSLDYMFARHELSYYNFVGRPQFSGSAEVSILAPEGKLLYSYADGRLKRVRNVSYTDGAYTFNTDRLETFILANAPMSEGVVDESKNTVRP